MFPEKSLQSGRPTAVSAAFWTQLAVAGLLVALTLLSLVSAIQFWRLFDDTPDAFRPAVRQAVTPLAAGLPLALAAWLAVTAAGLRRGSRTAHRLSLAGLTLPLLVALAASTLDRGTSDESFGGFAYAAPGGESDAVDLAARVATLSTVSTVLTTATAAAALVLLLTTTGLLLTAPSRRFFAHRPDSRTTPSP